MKKNDDKQILLDDLFSPYKNCLACPLSSLGRTQVVFGSGNPGATLMLIGEGPGKNEDEQGLPFVGRSGQLLTRVLSDLGIKREELYIANIVKCRPPNNRAPLISELSVCKKLLLDKQIAIIKPKVICTLGSSATNALLEKKLSITKTRGSIQTYKDICLIPTFHPAYLLMNPKKISLFSLDLKNAYLHSHRNKPPKTKFA